MAKILWQQQDENPRYPLTEEELCLELRKDKEGLYFHVELDYDIWQHNFRLKLPQELAALLGGDDA